MLDLGTGNGGMLRALRRRGWRGPLVGVDYCAESVELARRLTAAGGGGEESSDEDEDHEDDEDVEAEAEAEAERGGDAAAAILGETPPIEFYEFDILRSDSAAAPWWRAGPAAAGFDVVLDKGTFDAVSLSADTDARGRRAGAGYAAAVARLVRPGGLALVTSCNWTEDELVRWFAPAGGRGDLEEVDRVAYPRFRFGGAEGQTVAGVCFRRKEPDAERGHERAARLIHGLGGMC